MSSKQTKNYYGFGRAILTESGLLAIDDIEGKFSAKQFWYDTLKIVLENKVEMHLMFLRLNFGQG